MLISRTFLIAVLDFDLAGRHSGTWAVVFYVFAALFFLDGLVRSVEWVLKHYDSLAPRSGATRILKEQ